MKSRRIKDRCIHNCIIWGRLLGRETWVSIGDSDHRYLGAIEGYRLYRLAKAIVRHYEADKKGVK
ncbi:MAG: hypothetical protein WC455_12475 [Dehalococcoidia bacterium]|jgi:hypothetical protein